MKKSRICELCKEDATLYCPSDSAFLCNNCDAWVHQANFLVARHVRHTVCCKCYGFAGDRFSGVGFKHSDAWICPYCSPESEMNPGEQDDVHDSLSSSSSSTCISSATNTIPPSSVKDFAAGDESKFQASCSSEVTSEKTKRKTRRVKGKASNWSVDQKREAIFASWCRKLGVGLGEDGVVRTACRAFRASLELESSVSGSRPRRLAASLWLSFRLRGDRSACTRQTLKSLDEISGVPAKLILASESQLARAVKLKRERRRLQQSPVVEEGWAESCNKRIF